MKRVPPEDRARLDARAVRVGRRRLKRRLARAAVGRRRNRGRPVPKNGLIDEYAARAKLKPRKKGTPNRGRIDFPATFSFIDDPDAALAAIEEVVQAAVGRPRRLVFNQSACREVDFCAMSVLNALVVDLTGRQRVHCRGSFPNAPEPNEIARATGLAKALGALDPKDDPDNFLHHPLRMGRTTPVGAKRTSDRERESTALVEYINRCLDRFGFELADDGVHYLSSLVSEVINNAERHSGRPRWWVGGYLRAAPGAEVGDCQLAIFNFGTTIAESLRTLPETAALRSGIARLVSIHKDNRWFEPTRRWTEETLWTLFALQQGVSRKNDEPIGTDLGTNGQGTVDMIRTFQEMGQRHGRTERPAMAVVSGRTHIRFDGRYSMRPVREPDGTDRMTIAFNEENKLSERPDETAVRALDRYFPGTVISLRFFLDRRYLSQVHEHGYEGDDARAGSR